ncbi:hypothetical protein EsH8_III_001513 [Colletotrichum jinshuiense]
MSNKPNTNSGGPGNSSNPRPGQSPFPPSNALVRQTSTPQENQPYTSSYSNNFDRSNSRYSTGRTEDSSRYSGESIGQRDPPRSPPPRRQQDRPAQRQNWEDSIYGMYGDIRTPREAPPPPPRQEQQQRRQYQQPAEDDGNDSFDEEVPRRPQPRPETQRPRNREQRRETRSNQRQSNFRRDQQNDQQQQQQKQGQQGQQDGTYRRVNINIDVGGDGGRSWSWNADSRGGPNVNFGTPFVSTGFPFGGRNNNGGRLPVNLPFGGGGLPINLPFGL